MDYLALNLAYLLGENKATQAAIAEQVGVAQPTIGKWARLEETGSQPEFRKIAKLAAVLGVSLDDLVNRDIEAQGPSHPKRPDPENLATAMGTVDEILLQSGYQPAPLQKAAAISAAYEEISSGPMTMAKMARVTAKVFEILRQVEEDEPVRS